VKDRDLRLDKLLAKGNLGGPRYDRILDSVLERVDAPRPARRAAWVLAPLAGLSLAAVVVLIVIRPAREPLAPKGGDPATSVALSIGCASAAGGGACRVGDTLLFEVNAAITSGYLGAYAQRADAPGGERIWYFPSATGSAPRVEPGQGTVVVRKGIRLGPEHAPGRYRVTVWVSSRPLPRAEVDGAGKDVIRERATLELEVSR
jgi:hypothetical protein